MRPLLKPVAGLLTAALVGLGGMVLLEASAKPQVSLSQQAPKGWARERSDLPHDPDYLLGTLPNGMRYLILPNQVPPGQVAMRLMISAGSMQERPGEEGVAHFLEHLAFRGTKEYPDGEIQRTLEDLGLQMGDDANASTGADRTIFMLNMARNDTTSLDTGLHIFRQIVSAMNIAPEMVDAERGVVLAEERVRAGPGLEAQVALLKLQMGDHPFGRPPIGLRKVIETVTPERIRGFYDAYYRPERATLVIIGDINPAMLIPAIEARFSDWTGRGKPGGDPAPVTTKPPSPDVAMLVTTGAPDTSVMLRWFEPYRDVPRTKAERRKSMVESLGFGAISQRMQGFNEAAGLPARGVSAPQQNTIQNVWTGLTASSGSVTNVAGTIDLMMKASRQAQQFGITQEELDRQIALRLDVAKEAASRGRTGTSEFLVEGAVSQVAADAVFISAKDALAMFQEQVKTITLAEVNASLKAKLATKPVLIYRGPTAPAGGEQALRDAFNKAMSAKLAAYVPDAVKPWPYTDFGPAGKVAERKAIPDLGVTLVRFENGVKLTVKPMPSNKDAVTVQLRLGRGRLQMPINVIDASDMGLTLWGVGGLNKLTRTEEARTLTGKRVAADANTEDDAYTLDCLNCTTRNDFALEMQLMAAMVSDPAYRADDWASLMAGSDRAEESMPLTASGVMAREYDRVVHSGDLRWTINTKSMRDTWKPKDSVAYIRPIVEKSSIEVIVLGDIGTETVIAEVGRTLGALPPRPDFVEPPGWRDVKFPAPGTSTLPHKGRADQGFAMVAWPTYQGMFRNLREQQIGWVIGQMIRDNATRKFRSEGGATYSPTTAVDFSPFLPDYGYIGAMVEVPPDMISTVQAQMEAIAADLAANPVPASEVTRIVTPRLEQAKRDVAANIGFWLTYLAGAHEPQAGGPELIRTQIRDLQSITPADVQAMAKKWLRPETAWKLRVVPG